MSGHTFMVCLFIYIFVSYMTENNKWEN